MAWGAMQQFTYGDDGDGNWEPVAVIETDPPNQAINPMDVLSVLEPMRGGRCVLVGCGAFLCDKGVLTQKS